MKVHITVTNDKGARFEGSAELVRTSGKASKAAAKTHAALRAATKLSFSLNSRAFMNKYAKGMSGSRKFALLLAHLVQGKVGQEISGERIASTWNRMKSVLGGAYNPAHANRAKAEGWIDAPKWGHYELSNSWKAAVDEK
jgi:hypothetical protein